MKIKKVCGVLSANACELKVRRKLFTLLVIKKVEEEDDLLMRCSVERVINTSISSHGLVSEKE